MKDWVNEENGKLERRVAAREWEGKACRTLVVSRSYATEIEDLWDAVTNPERVKHWFAAVEGELREGGKYQIEGNASGTIKRCEEPRRVELTWEYGGEIGWVNIALASESEESTRLTLEHISEDGKSFLEFWKKYGPGAMGVGWDLALLGLEQHLNKDGAEFKPFSMSEEEWMATEEGKGFVRASSEGWVDASIEFGTTEAEAVIAGKQTTAFYTGEAVPTDET